MGGNRARSGGCRNPRQWFRAMDLRQGTHGGEPHAWPLGIESSSSHDKDQIPNGRSGFRKYDGGSAGIRTQEARSRACRFSEPMPSATRPRIHGGGCALGGLNGTGVLCQDGLVETRRPLGMRRETTRESSIRESNRKPRPNAEVWLTVESLGAGGDRCSKDAYAKLGADRHREPGAWATWWRARALRGR